MARGLSEGYLGTICHAAAAASALFLLRKPSKPRPPRAVANSESVPGTGTAVTLGEAENTSLLTVKLLTLKSDFVII